MINVFVSYALENESDPLRLRVGQLVEYLRANGCEVQCDLDFPDRPPPDRWMGWMHKAIASSDIVLMVCTALYRVRFENIEFDGTGSGVRFEGEIIRQALYENGLRNNRKYFPIQPDGGPIEDVPTILRDWRHGHYFPSGNARILRAVLGDSVPAQLSRATESALPLTAKDAEGAGTECSPDILARRAKRLSDGIDVPDFAGAWCEALVKELSSKGFLKLETAMDPDAHRRAVVRFFAESGEPKNLLIAMKKASLAAKGKLDDTAQRWAAELLTLAALRCTRFSGISLQRPSTTVNASDNAQVGVFPGNSHLIATLAVAALRGLKIEISSQARIMPMLTLNTQEDYVETALRIAYNSSYALECPPAVIEGKLSAGQKGDFRAWLDTRAYDGFSTSIGLILDHCPIETRIATAEGVANALDTLVLNGTVQADELVLASSGMDASSFHSHLKNVIDEFLQQA